MQDLFVDIFSLKDERAIITGGSSGIGFAIAQCFISAGAKVVILDRKKEEEVYDVLQLLGKNSSYYQYDVTDTDNTEKIINQVIEEQGDISILVNNAGNHCKKPIEDMTIDDFRSVLDVHVVGSFSLSKAIVPRMKKNNKGSIIFIASMTSFIGQPNVIGYSAAKSAYLGMVRTLSTEISSYGIRVNAIAPGWIDTPMLHKAIDNDIERKNKILSRTPSKTFGDPADIGWAAVYLSSKASKFVTGVALPVDGGALIGF